MRGCRAPNCRKRNDREAPPSADETSFQRQDQSRPGRLAPAPATAVFSKGATWTLRLAAISPRSAAMDTFPFRHGSFATIPGLPDQACTLAQNDPSVLAPRMFRDQGWDGWTDFLGLCRTSSSPHAQTQPNRRHGQPPSPKAAGVEEAIKATRGRQPQGIVRVRLQRSPATESPAARAGNYSRNGLSSCPLVSPAHPHA
jgi:hypothetical protein